MKNIDIDKLSLDELMKLNAAIVRRIKHLQAHFNIERMSKFNKGDKVSFQPPDRDVLFGMITRVNQKSVTVFTESGETWSLGPEVLTIVKDVNRPLKFDL
ncbi:hypothetical protein [Hydromonas duriensis]|uniref:Uncharacterized protein n=1 Tax=Hydromonas duriensis TaxID=1527608 RepID=A0A4V3DJG4_9BURK|nr:hypothetical protein [Hydromonas duriensis]TDR27010.1 hypothetical protein DFR44_1573 [Hydromonas duriensis]